MKKILKRKFISHKGFSYVFISIMIIIIMLIGVAVFETVRLNIQAVAVRDKFEDAIISMCVENYSKLYQPLREGHAASYGYDGSEWVENNNARYIYIENYLKSAMNSGEIMQCNIAFMTFDVQPADLAPSDVNTSEKYSVTGKIVIEIPYRFAWEDLPPITMQLDVKSQWRAKF